MDEACEHCGYPASSGHPSRCPYWQEQKSKTTNGGYKSIYKILILPSDPYYQVILERCIEVHPEDVWDVYSDGHLYLDWFVHQVEIERALLLYGPPSKETSA
jgi:hypothetical protein